MPASPPAAAGAARTDGAGCAAGEESAGETPTVHSAGAVHEATHSGWRSRGYLPHCDDAGLVQHIVFGLADALPRRASPALRDPLRRAKWADSQLDRGLGSRLLAIPRLALIVEDSLLERDGIRYRLTAWCIMPTHVHVVAEQMEGHKLAGVVQAWKSFTAHAINKLANRKGSVWGREYFDRFMRSDEQYEWTEAYVENNPVKAGLAACPEDWRFSSAWRRAHYGPPASSPASSIDAAPPAAGETPAVHRDGGDASGPYGGP